MTTLNDKGNLAATLVHVVHKYFIWVIVLSYGVAALLPQFGLWIRGLDLGLFLAPQGKFNLNLPPLMLAMLLFNAGLGVSLKVSHDGSRPQAKV
jgi:bile acid:Na+ symporter, BASS family